MLTRLVVLALALAVYCLPAEARRVALVIGQSAYPGGGTATIGLKPLANPRGDAAKMAALLKQNGFDVLSCDGTRPGCYDLDRERLLKALDDLAAASDGAELALVFFAGHGLASDEGNILTPIDAKVDCTTGAVTMGVPIERFMTAVKKAEASFLILDACRNNPIGDICPGLRNKKLSFTRIEAGQMKRFLLVTSTQFGQTADDGPKGGHSPFATALISALEGNPHIYFEQVLNDVARTTYDTAPKPQGIGQIPGKVVGGEAPKDCLLGKNCIGDPRMMALAADNDRLNAKVKCQANKAAKIKELADTQRKLLSPGPIAEIKLGSDDAPIVMVEYCAIWVPYCHIQHRDNMPEIKRQYIDTGKLLYIYRDIPTNEAGIQTHMLANCMSAEDRGQFLLTLYDRNPGVEWSKSPLAAAEKLGFSQAKIDACLADPKIRKDVTGLMDGMKRIDLIAMPTFFINNERTLGSRKLEFFDAAFEKILDPTTSAADTCE